MIYISAYPLLLKCLKHFDKGFGLSKLLLSERLVYSNWSEDPLCCDLVYHLQSMSYLTKRAKFFQARFVHLVKLELLTTRFRQFRIASFRRQ